MVRQSLQQKIRELGLRDGRLAARRSRRLEAAARSDRRTPMTHDPTTPASSPASLGLLRGALRRLAATPRGADPGAVYENAIDERAEQYRELKEAVAGILYMRNKLEAEIDERRVELARTHEDVRARRRAAATDELALALDRRESSAWSRTSSAPSASSTALRARGRGGEDEPGALPRGDPHARAREGPHARDARERARAAPHPGDARRPLGRRRHARARRRARAHRARRDRGPARPRARARRRRASTAGCARSATTRATRRRAASSKSASGNSQAYLKVSWKVS